MSSPQSGSSSERWIARSPAPAERAVEMQVFCFGLSRTGTWSLRTALDKLDYKTYHYTANIEPGNKEKLHLWCWNEALKAKLYNEGPQYGRKEFDKLLGSYSATTDGPCVNLADDLLKAYPNAKVVLNTRNVDSWLVSINNSLYKILENPWWRLMLFLGQTPEFIKVHDETLKLMLIDWTRPGNWQDREALKKGFLSHYDHIRSIVPKDRLLEHNSRDGWEPLCKFLGKPVPNEPYPHVNEGNNTWNMHKYGIIYKNYSDLAKKLILPMITVLLAAGVARYMKVI